MKEINGPLDRTSYWRGLQGRDLLADAHVRTKMIRDELTRQASPHTNALIAIIDAAILPLLEVLDEQIEKQDSVIKEKYDPVEHLRRFARDVQRTITYAEKYEEDRANKYSDEQD